jgi:hypothetical protein
MLLRRWLIRGIVLRWSVMLSQIRRSGLDLGSAIGLQGGLYRGNSVWLWSSRIREVLLRWSCHVRSRWLTKSVDWRNSTANRTWHALLRWGLLERCLIRRHLVWRCWRAGSFECGDHGLWCHLLVGVIACCSAAGKRGLSLCCGYVGR